MFKPDPRHFPSGAALALLLALNAPEPAPAQSAVSPAASEVAAPPVAPPPIAAAPVAPSAAAPMTGPQVIQVLDQTIDWYRTLGNQQQVSSEPSDLLILYDNRQTANQVIASAFEAARANAAILAKQPGPKDTEGASAASQSLSQLQNKFAAQGTVVRNELDAEQEQLAAARPEQKVELQAKISE